MLRFYDPVTGEILIDGKNIKDYPLSILRSQMALVPQMYCYSEELLKKIYFTENIMLRKKR